MQYQTVVQSIASERVRTLIARVRVRGCGAHFFPPEYLREVPLVFQSGPLCRARYRHLLSHRMCPIKTRTQHYIINQTGKTAKFACAFFYIYKQVLNLQKYLQEYVSTLLTMKVMTLNQTKNKVCRQVGKIAGGILPLYIPMYVLISTADVQ